MKIHGKNGWGERDCHPKVILIPNVATVANVEPSPTTSSHLQSGQREGAPLIRDASIGMAQWSYPSGPLDR